MFWDPFQIIMKKITCYMDIKIFNAETNGHGLAIWKIINEMH